MYTRVIKKSQACNAFCNEPQILDFIGGEKNIASGDYCATRIRLKVANSEIIDVTSLEKIEGILGVVNEDELQIVLGKNTESVYEKMQQSISVLVVEEEPVYNDVETWRIAFFALNNTATNMYMMGMTYVSYYATGVAGLLVTVVGVVLTSMRLWDGITDPIVGYFIDKTDGKFGKFRPFMIIGNIILGVMMMVIYYTTQLVPVQYRLLYFIFTYALYIIGYTCQTACTKAGQACMTNNPKQRPMFGLFDSIYMAVIMTFLAIYVSNILVPKYGGFNDLGLFIELGWFVVIGSAICTILAIIGIWTKDRTEFFGLGEGGDEVTFKDYGKVIKGNRPLQLLIVAASMDKIAMSVATNATVTVMLYGILIGDYGLSGIMGLIILVPRVVITLWGTRFAGKFGLKKALVRGMQMAMALYTVMFFLLYLGDPRTISLSNMNFMTIAYIVIQMLAQGAVGMANAFVIPMISDCADYETSISGRFVPGMMGTLFSFVDKMISSLATTIVALAVAAIGFTTVMPDVNDALTRPLMLVTLFLYIGLPMIGWTISLTSMKFYELDAEKMLEVQSKLQSKRVKA